MKKSWLAPEMKPALRKLNIVQIRMRSMLVHNSVVRVNVIIPNEGTPFLPRSIAISC